MTNTFSKSSLVLGYDGTPVYRPTYGFGGGRTVVQMASINPGATDASTVVYRMIRVPSNVIVNKLELNLDLNGGTATTLTGNICLYYSDNGAVDGTSAVKSGTNTALSASFFAYQKAFAAVGVVGGTGNSGGFLDTTFANAAGNSATDGFYTPSAAFQPLWLAMSAGGYQGQDSTLNAPKGPYSATQVWGGLGAVTSSSNDFYQLTADPGVFLDICFQPTSTNSLSAATMILSLRATLTYPG